MPDTISKSEFTSLPGREFEPSSWLEITQDRVDKFADATNDHQFIHVDPHRAAKTPFGGPIAHGYLTLSLIPHMVAEQSFTPHGLVMAINYGSDRCRFLQPVRVGSRIRACQRVLEVTEKKPGQFLVKLRVTVDIENERKPALIADVLSMYIIE